VVVKKTFRYSNVFFYNHLCRNSVIRNIIMESGINFGWVQVKNLSILRFESNQQTGSTQRYSFWGWLFLRTDGRKTGDADISVQRIGPPPEYVHSKLADFELVASLLLREASTRPSFFSRGFPARSVFLLV